MCQPLNLPGPRPGGVEPSPGEPALILSTAASAAVTGLSKTNIGGGSHTMLCVCFTSNHRDPLYQRLLDEICMHSAATGSVIGFDGR